MKNLTVTTKDIKAMAKMLQTISPRFNNGILVYSITMDYLKLRNEPLFNDIIISKQIDGFQGQELKLIEDTLAMFINLTNIIEIKGE